MDVQVITPGERQVTVFVGVAANRTDRPSDYEFVKIGKTPVAFELPANQNFWLEVESPHVTRGGLLLRMDGKPKHLQVDPGSSDMADLASLSLATGGLSIAAATVILLSGSKGEGGIDKTTVLIPLYAAGAAVFGGGIALFFASRTHVDDPSQQRAPKDAHPRAPPGSASLPVGARAGISIEF